MVDLQNFLLEDLQEQVCVNFRRDWMIHWHWEDATSHDQETSYEQLEQEEESNATNFLSLPPWVFDLTQGRPVSLSFGHRYCGAFQIPHCVSGGLNGGRRQHNKTPQMGRTDTWWKVSYWWVSPKHHAWNAAQKGCDQILNQALISWACFQLLMDTPAIFGWS